MIESLFKFTGIKSNMKNRLMTMRDKPFLKTIRYQLFAITGYISQTLDRKRYT
jgi:hypothetical protein